MWISRKRFNALEKKVANIERNQNQIIDVIETQIEVQQGIKIDDILSSINREMVKHMQE